MTIAPTITLDARQSAAFTKRITGEATAETLAATVVQEWSERYAIEDDVKELNEIQAAVKADPALLTKLKAVVKPSKPTK